MSQKSLSFTLPPSLVNGLGIGASGLCIMHCLLTPVVVLLIPLVGLVLPGEEEVHKVFLLVVSSLGLLAFTSGYMRHRRAIILALPLAGIALLATPTLADELAGVEMGELAESLFVVSGGTLMILGHWLNQTFCRSCEQCCDDEGCQLTSAAGAAGD